MKPWLSLSYFFPDNSKVLAREQRLTQAYNSVFRGSPSSEDQSIVLADLAFHSGFSMVSPPSVSDAELRVNEGKRTMFARIRARINLTPQDHDALDNAARREAVTFYEPTSR